MRTFVGAILIGAAGSLIGRRVIAPGIQWHAWVIRTPLPDVFGFVEGKRDRDDFERM